LTLLTACAIIAHVIASFADSQTEALFQRRRAKRFGLELQRAALRKLDMLDAAVQRADLRAPSANRLEALKGDRAGQFSIRVNDQWRICFTWRNGNAHDVEMVDYH
jgi:toxin HigB-1